MKVLIADDSVVSRHLLERTLQKWNYDVIVACDGREAWEALQRDDAPALAILDWMMPGYEGLEICRLVREAGREPYTYILLLTSRNLKEDVVAGMGAGADDYITKPFDEHELQVRLRAGRRIVELQAELLRAREELREQATHDALTRVWNRSSIFDILARELNRAERERGRIGVVLVDLDHFKSINDTFGHIAGDAVLKDAVRRMQAAMRPYDSIGRYGGEEFLIVLPGCDERGTAGEAERLRVAISREPMNLSETSVSITASFGATSATGDSRVPSEALIRRADEALLKAKRSGRNQVIFVELTDRWTELAPER